MTQEDIEHYLMKLTKLLTQAVRDRERQITIISELLEMQSLQITGDKPYTIGLDKSIKCHQDILAEQERKLFELRASLGEKND